MQRETWRLKSNFSVRCSAEHKYESVPGRFRNGSEVRIASRQNAASRLRAISSWLNSPRVPTHSGIDRRLLHVQPRKRLVEQFQAVGHRHRQNMLLKYPQKIQACRASRKRALKFKSGLNLTGLNPRV